MTEIKPAYLIAGTDEAKIDAAIARLRARAEREGGPGSLQSFRSDPGSPPDADALLAAIPTMSLTAARRYLLADGIERWSAAQSRSVGSALPDLPPDVTVVLVGREQPPRRTVPKALADAVRAAGGEVLSYGAPRPRELPGWLAAEAERRGFRLDANAARLLIERMGHSTVRLANELDRLAMWAGDGGEVGVADLEAMIADTSEEAVWALSDAIVGRDAPSAIAAAERLVGQGESVTSLIYQAARRLREGHRAVTELERGRPAKEIESSLDMHPYAARMLLRRVRGASPDELRAAACAVADLEWWTRGGSDYPEEVALTLAVRRAAGAGDGV
jgi:DNA polymerase III subunit delta